MRKAILKRDPSTDEGTFGQIMLDDGKHWFTGELPWRDNQPDKSCIPSGTYTCRCSWSPKHHMRLYHVLNVPGRGDVEIHIGNWCGDVDKGYKSDVLGCIILGMGEGVLDDQKAVVTSEPAVYQFMGDLLGEDFELTIEDAA